MNHDTPTGPGITSQLVQEVLTKVDAHVQCATDIWLKSRHSFRITRKDKVVNQVRVANLKKKLSQAPEMENYENLQQAFHLALALGAEFLNSCMDCQG